MKRWPIVVILAWALLLTTPLHAGKIYLMGGGYDDANTDLFWELIPQASDLECDLPFITDCDCPATNGFDCVAGVCTWEYI